MMTAVSPLLFTVTRLHGDMLCLVESAHIDGPEEHTGVSEQPHAAQAEGHQ